MSEFTNITEPPFTSRADAHDQRLGDRVQWAAFDKLPKRNEPPGRDWVLAGYPDDEGIGLNGGRRGASQAPLKIREHLLKLTPPDGEPINVVDVGDLEPVSDLKGRHEKGRHSAFAALEYGYRWLAFGGGHDYGYCEAMALVDYAQKIKTTPLVINFDAHLDVRPTGQGLSSGTPFFRLLEASRKVDFFEVGIQRQCASLHHINWLEEKGGRVVFLDDILAHTNPIEKVMQILAAAEVGGRPTFLSIDIDGFSSAFAMGCSQSFATGFSPEWFLPLIDKLCAFCDIRAAGIYEVSPPLDSDDRTSKLAALIAHRLIFAKQYKR